MSQGRLKQSEFEIVALGGGIALEHGGIARALEHIVVRRRALHKAEAESVAYDIVDDYAEKVEFEDLVEDKFAADGLHYLRAAEFLAVGFGHDFYFEFHKDILTPPAAFCKVFCKYFTKRAKKITKWVYTKIKTSVIIKLPYIT